ncbi:MAG: SDR family oxidoreductase [Dehalococcoidales bacterium]|nr:SDR family oxidoreductase [Dehalococcoidales bacterium]
MSLNGKIAIVTGGGTGIGAATAKRLVKEGAKVCISGRRADKLDETAASVPAGSIVTCPADVSKSEDIDKIVAAAIEFGGKIDILVNNAAIEAMAPLTELPIEEWRNALDINLTGPFMMMKKVVPIMVENGGGSIINIASIAGIRTVPGMPAYCTTKAAVIMLSRQVATDYGAHNVRCNAILPGATRTEMNKKLVEPIAAHLETDLEGGYKYFTKDVPLRRAAQPDEIAGLCAFLAGDDSAYMTGAALVMDGGATTVDLQGAALAGILGG